MNISVIVPIYNVEDYLEQCLESIINQDYKDFEVILVNDGSIDGSVNIAKRYCEKYKNFKLINKTNGGLSSARNVGLENCNGKYVVFIDSDDYISKQYLSKLYYNLIENDSDISICSFERVCDLYNKVENIGINETNIYSNIDMLKLILQGKVQCYAWNKMYKKEIFITNNIRYPLGKLYEDIETFVKLVINSKKISVVNEALYKYRIREGSITSKKSKKEVLDLNYAIDEVNKLLYDNNFTNQVYNELINFNIMYTLSSLDMVAVYTDYSLKKFYSEYKVNFNQRYLDYNIKFIIFNNKILYWVKRDFILFKFRLLLLKNKIRDNKCRRY